MTNAKRSELVTIAEQALSYIRDAGTGTESDPSYMEPRKLSRTEIQTNCKQAFRLMQKIKTEIENL